MKREAFGHTKMKRLCRRLNIRLWQAVGILESLWALTARECPRGDVGRLSDEDIALGIDWVDEPAILIEALRSSGWIDEDSIDRLVIHDWYDHSDDSVHMKLARAHLYFVGTVPPKLSRLNAKERESCEQFYNPCARHTLDSLTKNALPEPRQSQSPAGAPPVPGREEPPVVPQSQNSENAPNGAFTETPTGKKKTVGIAELRSSLGERLAWWTEFWKIYPCKDGEKPAIQVYSRVVTTYELAVEVYKGAKRYAARITADPTAKVKYAQGWLNDERWRDEGPVHGNGHKPNGTVYDMNFGPTPEERAQLIREQEEREGKR